MDMIRDDGALEKTYMCGLDKRDGMLETKRVSVWGLKYYE